MNADIDNLVAHTTEHVRNLQDERELKILGQFERGIITPLEFLQKINEITHARFESEHPIIKDTWSSPVEGKWYREYPNGDQATIDEYSNSEHGSIFHWVYSDSAGQFINEDMEHFLIEAQEACDVYNESFTEKEEV